MKTTVSAKQSTVKRDWYLIDATDKILGRLASDVASHLSGKNKPEYTPHVDTGDYVVIINAKKIKVTGNKFSDKMYHHHTGFIGNLKSISFDKLLQKSPEKIIFSAVKGMLPKNRLGRSMIKKLRVYPDNEHKHHPQQPQNIQN
ncbi:MAG: 50S ribosomal protein L13 [Pseudomonadota bacterium]